MKLKIIGIITIINFIASSSFACNQSVKYLTQDTPAPCTGYLFSPEKELEVRIAVEENKHLYKIVDTQKKLINNLDQQTNIYERRERLNDLEKFAYFIGGALITAIIARNVD